MSNFVPFESSFLTSSPVSVPDPATSEVNPEATEPQPTIPVVINDIVLNVRVRYNYDEIDRFIDELQLPKENMLVNKQKLSVFQLYTLYMLDDPVDMTSQTERKVYRPKLFIRKNDKFSPFNFCYLLNLLDIDYELSETNGKEFPIVWKTTFDTKITVNVVKLNHTEDGRMLTEQNSGGNNVRNLLDVCKIICREQKYDESHAIKWKQSFEGKMQRK